MRCPNPECSSYSHRVEDTDGRQDPLTFRSCRCPQCGHHFDTVEYPVASEAATRIFQEFVLPNIRQVEFGRRQRKEEMKKELQKLIEENQQPETQGA